MQHREDGPDFARLLVTLSAQRRTGVLEVRAEGVTTVLYLQGGRVVFAEQGTLSATLGRLLVREGKLTQRQYARIIDHMTTALVESEQMRFGEAAVALGYLQPAEVHEALAAQVRQKLLGCFQWEHVEWTYDEGDEPLRSLAHFPCDTSRLVLEGVRRCYDTARCERLLSPFESRYVRLLGKLEDMVEQLGLGPMESRLLRAIDGNATVADLLARGEPDGLRARQVLAALVLTGAVQLRQEAEQPVRSHESVAAPTPTATPDEVAAPAGQAAERLAAEIARRRRAGRAPPRRSSIPPADEQRARLEAEQAYQRARRHMGYDAWPLALDELRRAVRRRPEAIEYELCAAWAEYRVAQPTGEPEIAAWRARLGTLASRALKTDRNDAFAWHVQGQLAALAGDDAKALKYFRVALRLDASDREAMRFVRLLSARLDPKSKRRK